MAANFTKREIIEHKIKKLAVPVMAGHNRKKLNNIDFSIISNNCWGGYALSTLISPKTVLL